MNLPRCLLQLTLAWLLPLLCLLRAATPGAADRLVLPEEVIPLRYDITVQPNAKALNFKGSVLIELKVLKPTSHITLNAKDLVIDQAQLSSLAETPKLSYEPATETASFSFSSPLACGEYQLRLEYHGRIFQQAQGLFALDYGSPGGETRALFTQFENGEARSFVPCWDEPARKASFRLSAIVPSGLMAVSNMPIAKVEALPESLQQVSFAPTPAMSSYLLFFGLGDLERIHRTIDGTDVGIIFKRGEAANAEYALDAAAELLHYYNDYFGLRYPLPKLDLVAAPGASPQFEGMENWGAILFFERALLFDASRSTAADKQNVYSIVAHEMAHQWFGDLVTMQWWDDLWLNEGYASWMATKASAALHPEWKIWTASLRETNAGMQQDASKATHPIITPCQSVMEANSAFDAITYLKGQAVIRMLEAYLGEEPFRRGIHNYLTEHAYGNAVTDDLWTALDAVSERKATQIAHDFTLQAGVPLVTVEIDPQGGLRLTQSRFAVDDSGASSGNWHIPLLLAAASDKAGVSSQPYLLTAASALKLPSLAAGTVVNAGQNSYVRVHYKDGALAAVQNRFSQLADIDQLELLCDACELGKAGQTSLSDFLKLASKLPPTAEPIVWSTLADQLEVLNCLYGEASDAKYFREYTRGLLKPCYQNVGFEPIAGESSNTAILRLRLQAALCRAEDRSLISEAHDRFQLFLKNADSMRGDTRRTVLYINALHADQETWTQLHHLALQSTSTLEKQQYYRYLGVALDQSLAKQALNLALTEEPNITYRINILLAVAHFHPELAFDFAVAHWEEMKQVLEDPEIRSTFIAHLLDNSIQTESLARLDAFAAAHVPASQAAELRKIKAAVNQAAIIHNQRLPEMDRWIQGQLAKSSP